MKTKHFFLALLIMVTFGTPEIFAQTMQQSTTSQTTKPKRKYTKKVKVNDNLGATTASTVPVEKVKRKYTRKVKPEVANSVMTNSTAVSVETPKRKYTRKVKSDNTAETAPIQNTITATNPVVAKRKYVRKTAATYNTNAASPAPAAVPNVVARTTVQNNRVTPQKTAYRPSSGGVEGNHQILVGPRGGRYYINKNGNKTYVK